MSYSTIQTLQYGVTPAQEFAAARPHVPSFKHCDAILPPHRDVTERKCAANAADLTFATQSTARQICLPKPDANVGIGPPDGCLAALTAIAARLKCLSRAAPKRRHASFSLKIG